MLHFAFDVAQNGLLLVSVRVIPKNEKNFNVDNVRVVKILGAGVLSSRVTNGMLFKRGAEGEIKKMEKAKIAVYSGPFDVTQTETKVRSILQSFRQVLLNMIGF